MGVVSQIKDLDNTSSSDTKPIASLLECCCMDVVSQIKDLDNTSSLPAPSALLCEILR